MKEKKKSSIKDIIIGIIVLIILGFIIIIFFKFISNIIVNLVTKIGQLTSKMDAVIIVALITGMVSILGVVLSAIVSKILEYRQNTKRYLYEKREEPYSDFIEMVYKIQRGVKAGEIYSQDEMIQDTMVFSKKLTLWGSNKVIRKWLNFRDIAQKENSDPMKNLFILEEIIFEIRKDMGQKKRGLKKGDILAFFINDIKHHLS